MNDAAIIAQAVGFLIQTVGLVTVAVRTGAWKGQVDNKIDFLEKQTKAVSEEVKAMGSRQDGFDRELTRIVTVVETNLEYIKKTLDDIKAQKKD